MLPKDAVITESYSESEEELTVDLGLVCYYPFDVSDLEGNKVSVNIINQIYFSKKKIYTTKI